VFAASLDHLVTTPRLYGWDWDFGVDTGGDSAQAAAANVAAVTAQLDRSDDVAGYADTVISRLDVDGRTVTALGVHHAKGDVGPTIVSGRAPRSGREIALGGRTLDQIGAAVGDTVRVRSDAGGTETSMRVVGRVVLPGLGTYPGSDKTALGEGALLTRATLHRTGPDFGAGPFLVRLAPHATRAAVQHELSSSVSQDQLEVGALERPSDIVAYERVRSTPLLLAGVLAVLALATVAHALVTVVRRRRRDLALLKTLGFDRSQLRTTIAWQATAIAVVGLVVGIPLGLLVGNTVWRFVADGLGVADVVAAPALVLLIIPAVVLLVNAVAYFPGRAAARTRPAVALRAE